MTVVVTSGGRTSSDDDVPSTGLVGQNVLVMTSGVGHPGAVGAQAPVTVKVEADGHVGGGPPLVIVMVCVSGAGSGRQEVGVGPTTVVDPAHSLQEDESRAKSGFAVTSKLLNINEAVFGTWKTTVPEHRARKQELAKLRGHVEQRVLLRGWDRIEQASVSIAELPLGKPRL